MANNSISIDKNPQYIQNVNQTVISITEDKLENILLKNQDVIKAKIAWSTPVAMFCTCIVALVTSSFKKFIFVPEVWTAIFAIASICTFIWSVILVIRAIKVRKKGDVDSLISIIKKEQSAK